MSAYVVVLAADHPDRDAWVDDQARQAPASVVEVSDATYQGVWRLPVPERTAVHLFADPGDVDKLTEIGLERASHE
jgi:hypothetical protein